MYSVFFSFLEILVEFWKTKFSSSFFFFIFSFLFSSSSCSVLPRARPLLTSKSFLRSGFGSGSRLIRIFALQC